MKNHVRTKNIEGVRSSLSRTMIIIFFIFLLIILTLWSAVFTDYQINKTNLINQQLKSTILLFKTNVSEKLSIIANSLIFVNFIRSGNDTREKLQTKFVSEMLTLKEPAIVGMDIDYVPNQYMRRIEATQKTNLFTYGEKTPYFVTLPICYLNDRLDSIYGICENSWTLYFSNQNILSALQRINSDIKGCAKSDCKRVNILSDQTFGSFPVTTSSNLNIYLTIKQPSNSLVYSTGILTIISLFILILIIRYKTRRIVNQAFANPINNITESLKKGGLPKTEGYLEELEYLANQIKLYYEGKDKIEIAKIANQAAHDIRSPLTALDFATKDLSAVPEKQRLLIRDATRHIRDIANNLLQQNVTKEAINFEKLKDVMLMPIVEYVLSEKRSETAERQINISTELSDDAYTLFVNVIPRELKRLLSNLCNNSIEAIKNQEAKYITLKIWAENQQVNISIIDNGAGISDDKLPVIFREGVSFKKDGSGLGLYHAKKNITAWNGGITVQSEVTKGTTVTISLPQQKIAPWFAEHITALPSSTIFVIDDSPTIKNVWQERLHELNRDDSMKLRFFANPDEFLDWYKKSAGHNQRTNIYLIDYEYAGTKTTGLDIIREIGAQSQSFLVTSRAEDFGLQEQCLLYAIKLISKYYASKIPIKLIEHPHLVLLEKDKLLCRVFENRALKKHKILNIYNDLEELMYDVKLLDRNTPLYIADDFLKHTTILVDLGFSNITIISNNPETISARLFYKIKNKIIDF